MPRYGATFLVMHGPQTVVEPPYRTKQVVVEFPSYQAALDCFNTPAYSAAAQLRHALAAGAMVMVEGYDGPQGLDLLRRPAKRPQTARAAPTTGAASGAATAGQGQGGPMRRLLVRPVRVSGVSGDAKPRLANSSGSPWLAGWLTDKPHYFIQLTHRKT